MKNFETLSFSWEFILIGLIFLVIGFLWIRQIYKPIIKLVPWRISEAHLFLKWVARISAVAGCTLFVIWGSFYSPSLELFRAEVLLFMAIAFCIFLSAMIAIVIISILDFMGLKEEVDSTSVWLIPFMSLLIIILTIILSDNYPVLGTCLGGIIAGVLVFFLWRFIQKINIFPQIGTAKGSKLLFNPGTVEDVIDAVKVEKGEFPEEEEAPLSVRKVGFGQY